MLRSSSGRESSEREAAVFFFLVFFNSTIVTLQVIPAISISEGLSAEVLFLAEAARCVIAIKPSHNDLLYVKQH